MKGLGFLAFVFITICCWGVYGPVLHHGQLLMGDGPRQLSLLKPIVGVGCAYFLIAVLFPMFMLISKGEKGHWTASGFVWSFVAGAVGAIGAIGIALSFKFGGQAVYVMPLVFGFAPVVNTIVTMLMSRTIGEASPLFYAGVIIVAVGAAGVLVFKPVPATPHSSVVFGNETVVLTAVSLVTQQPESGQGNNGNDDGEKTGETPEETGTAAADKAAPAAVSATSPNATTQRSIPMIVCCIALAALCWGSYGPVLHKGQMKMSGSRLRPFLCVGIAYFVLAVILPMFLLGSFPEKEGWFNSGMFWSMLAGAAGAVGALGIIYAFNFGGRPIFVMPLVFGCAPVVNTFSQTMTASQPVNIPSAFYLSLFLVILGAIIVLTCAPRGHGPKPVEAVPAS